MDRDIADVILQELSSLRDEVRRLENKLPDARVVDARDRRDRVAVHFGDSPGERKPFAMTLSGLIKGSYKLSAVRAAIFLILLLDLQDRSEGGKGVIDTWEAILDAVEVLDESLSDRERLGANTRVALYRFQEMLDGQSILQSENITLSFDIKACRLSIDPQNDKDVTDINFDVTSASPALAEVINKSLSTSPLTRLRKRGALYLPSSDEGHNRLLLELFDHKYPLFETALFYRPSIHSYPVELLRKVGAPQNRIKRCAVALKAYETGRLHFREILNREQLLKLIRIVPGRGYASYPSTVETSDVIGQLNYMIDLVDRFPGYELCLTDAFFPFHLTTFRIDSAQPPDFFTLFFQRFEDSFSQSLHSFAVCDPAVYQSVMQNIVDWVLQHPTTISDRGQVKQELRSLVSTLETSGPVIGS